MNGIALSSKISNKYCKLVREPPYSKSVNVSLLLFTIFRTFIKKKKNHITWLEPLSCPQGSTFKFSYEPLL